MKRPILDTQSQSHTATSHDDEIIHSSKTNPTMIDLHVHRLRNLNYTDTPGSILTLAVRDTTVAVARDTGSVQLYRRDHPSLRHVSTIAGYNDRPITSLVWTIDERLLIGASHSDIVCVDLAQHTLRSWTPSGGGGVYDLVVLENEQEGNPCCTLAAACQDGSIRVFDVLLQQETKNTDASVVQLRTVYPPAGDAILSLAYCATQQHLFVAIADGTMRCYDTRTQRCRHRMTLASQGRGVRTQVWDLAVSKNGDTLLAADSLGQVQVWDGTTGTWIASIQQNDHQADVLALVLVETDGQNSESARRKVYCSGVHPRLVCIEQSPQTGEWSVTHTITAPGHSHDVRAMATLHNGSDLVTGGVDTQLCVTPLLADQQRLGAKRNKQLRVYPWPNISPITVGGRVLALQRPQSIDVHRLASAETAAGVVQKTDTPKSFPIVCPPDTLWGSVQLTASASSSSSRANARCCALNLDGTVLAVASDVLLLFWLHDGSSSDKFAPQRISIAPSEHQMSLTSVTAMKFLANNTLVVATTGVSSRLLLLSIDADSKSATIVSSVPCLHSDKGLPVHDIAVHGNFIATLSSGKEGSVQVYRSSRGDNRDKDDNGQAALQHWWTLPYVGKRSSAIGFLQHSSTASSEQIQLAVACVNYSFYIFDVAGRTLSKWSEQQTTASGVVRMVLPVAIKQNLLPNNVPNAIRSHPQDSNTLLLVRSSKSSSERCEIKLLPRRCCRALLLGLVSLARIPRPAIARPLLGV